VDDGLPNALWMESGLATILEQSKQGSKGAACNE
jgi:hypothetical protein